VRCTFWTFGDPAKKRVSALKSSRKKTKGKKKERVGSGMEKGKRKLILYQTDNVWKEEQ
jgi:hypothetical protein